MQGVALHDYRVGCPEAARHPVLVADTHLNIESVTLNGENVDVIHINPDEVGHVPVFVQIEKLVRFDRGVAWPILDLDILWGQVRHAQHLLGQLVGHRPLLSEGTAGVGDTILCADASGAS